MVDRSMKPPPPAIGGAATSAINRRAVMTRGGLFLAAACLPAGQPPLAARQMPPSAVGLTAWVRITADDEVTLVASQSEMGQGTTTTLAAALADELFLPLERVNIAFAPFDPAYRDPVYNWMFTGNSQGTSSFYDLMRRMGAAAREMLMQAAADRWQVSADTVIARDGRIVHPEGSISLSFGQLAADAGKLMVPASPKLRQDPPSAGRALRRWDIPAKVDGSAQFGIDVKLPRMLVAAVRCAPRFGGKLESFDRQAIERKPGIAAVVEVPGGLAVVGQSYWQARRALDAAALRWNHQGSNFTSSSVLAPVFSERLKAGPFFTHKREGSLLAAEPPSTRLEATYQLPFQAHATMEPMNCTALVTRKRCEIWAPTQGVELAHGVAAQVTGLHPDRIIIHRTLIGGGFGRRLLADFIKQTLIVAMALKQPVKLIWSREEDMSHDFYRPAVLHGVSGVLDRSGSIVSLAHRVVSPSHMLYILPRGMFPQAKDWTDPVAAPEAVDTMAVEGLLALPYGIPGQLVEQHRLQLDVPVSVWRTTGHGQNNFVVECFVDELAAAAGKDPVAFRLGMLQDERARGALSLAAAKSGWGGAAAQGASRGVALAKAFGGYVAAVAEVLVEGSAVKVCRLVLAVDCGRVLDPGIATSNILGGAVWGLSAMRTAVTFEGGRVVQENFDSFQPMHLWENPRCDVYFAESQEKVGGTGELGPVAVPAAVANGIFAASGRRIRSLPLGDSGLSFA
jgi:isoquinoline 1-oxidoreductase beta subunit